jgi:ABC-type methionine transport system ATPase subunit
VKNRIVLYFSAAQSEQPIIYRLVKEYDLVVNILKANINPQKEGLMVMELTGEKDNYEAGCARFSSPGAPAF